MRHGPLGKYSQIVAAGLATLIVVTALGVRVVAIFTEITIPSTTFLDNLALIAMGAVFGAAATTAVNGASIEAAHRRLDGISAPAPRAVEDEATRPD